MRVETLAWVAKAERKHAAHGYPLVRARGLDIAARLLVLRADMRALSTLPQVSALLCAEADEAQLRAFVEGPLLRALRDKERAVRSAALESLHTVVRFYAATRNRAPHAAPDGLWVATSTAIAAIPASFRRAGGVSRAFVSDAAVEVLVSIAAWTVQVDSALVLEATLPDLLKDAPSSDAAVAALRALSGVVSVAGAESTRDVPKVLGEAGLAQALKRVRRGHAALGELGIGGAVPVQLRSAIGTVARAASAALAHTTAPTKKGEQLAIDGAMCAMVCALLDCVPFVLPDDWRGDGALATTLPGFLGFPDAAVRVAAAAALRRAMHAGVGGRDQSSARAALLEAAAEYALRCVAVEATGIRSAGNTVDATPPAASEVAGYVLMMTSEWRAALLDAVEACELGGRTRRECIFSRIEGAAVVMAVISSTSASTRQAALALIADVAALCRLCGHPEMPLADVLNDSCNELSIDPASMSAASDGRLWATTFCLKLASAAPLAPCAVLAARAHSMRCLQHAMLAVTSLGRDEGRNAAIETWRAAACVAVATLNAPESADQAVERMLLVKEVIAPLRTLFSDMSMAVECALSCSTPGAASAFAAELSSLVADAAQALRRQAAELRHAAALIVRCLATARALKAVPVEPLLHFVEDALTTLSQTELDAAGETEIETHDWSLALRMALVETAVALPVRTWAAPLRARLFDACATAWSTVLRVPVDACDAKLVSVQDNSGSGLLSDERLPRLNAELQRVAADACAALAAAPMDELFFPASSVLQWASRALETPQSVAAARRALCAAASSEPASLPLLLDAAYVVDAPAANSAYFSALATGVVAHCRNGVCSSSSTLPPLASLLAVTLLFCADARSEVRCDALAVLRAILPAVGPSAASLLGSHARELSGECSNSCSSVMSLLGSRLAADAPSLCLDACSELLRRVLQIFKRMRESTERQLTILQALKVLPTWLKDTSLHPEAAVATPGLLAALFGVSCFSASALDGRAECADALWVALCARPANATVVTDFLLQQRKSSLQPVTQTTVGTDRPRSVTEHDNVCTERCLFAVAGAQPHAVAACLLAALGAQRLDPGATSPEIPDAALVLLSALSAAPPHGFRAELTSAAPALLHAALVVLCRGSCEDSPPVAAFSASSGVPLVAPDSCVRMLQSHAQKLLDSIASLVQTSTSAEAMNRPCVRLSAADALLWHDTTETDAAPSLFPDAAFDALAALEGCSTSAITVRGTVLRSLCASKALVVLADSISHNEASCAAAVLRALRRPLCQQSATVLCESIVACLSPGRASRVPRAAGLFAAQCLAVLAPAAEATPPAKLLLYPSVFWAAAAALRSPLLLLVPPACAVLLAFVRALAPDRPDAPPGVAEEVFLLAAPGVAGLPGASAARGSSFPGLARVALQATCTSSTELAPMLLAQLGTLSCGGAADALYGEAEGRLWLAFGGALPWILSESDHPKVSTHSTLLARREAASRLAAGARCRRGSTALVAALEAIAAGTCSGMGACEALRAPLALALAPSTSALLAASLLEVVRAGADDLTAPALALLHAVFDAPCGVRPVPDLTPLTAAAAGRHGAAARAALTSALSASSRSGVSVSQSTSAAGASVLPLWPEHDAEAAAGLLSDVLAGSGAKRRDAPSFLFQ